MHSIYNHYLKMLSARTNSLCFPGQQKFDTSANDMLTYRALKGKIQDQPFFHARLLHFTFFFTSSTVLSAMLLACGGDIPPDKFKVSFFFFVLVCHLMSLP